MRVCASRCVGYFIFFHVFGLFLKSDGDWVDVTSCVESAEGFVL